MRSLIPAAAAAAPPRSSPIPPHLTLLRFSRAFFQTVCATSPRACSPTSSSWTTRASCCSICAAAMQPFDGCVWFILFLFCVCCAAAFSFAFWVTVHFGLVPVDFPRFSSLCIAGAAAQERQQPQAQRVYSSHSDSGICCRDSRFALRLRFSSGFYFPRVRHFISPAGYAELAVENRRPRGQDQEHPRPSA
jgi:hypothetical protein